VRVGSSQFDPDVLRAIAVLNDGIRVDWGQYALDVVKDCADGVKRELFSIRRPSSLDLYGCSALVTVHSTRTPFACTPRTPQTTSCPCLCANDKAHGSHSPPSVVLPTLYLVVGSFAIAMYQLILIYFNHPFIPFSYLLVCTICNPLCNIRFLFFFPSIQPDLFYCCIYLL
jgi:hypothetical protein